MADALDVTTQSLRNWRKLPGAPSEPDLAAWASFVEKHDLGRKESPETQALRAEKLRREIALLDIRLHRERAQVIPVDQVADLLRKIAAGQRRELIEWAESHTPDLAPGRDLAEIRANQMEAAYRICDRMEGGLARWLA